MTRLFAGTPFDREPHCEGCDQLESECTCPPPPEPTPQRQPPEQQTAKLAVEKRKRGKVVTIVRGLEEPATDLPSLLTTLKNKCGAGGSLQEGHIEIQGRQLDRVRSELQSIGYRVKG